MAAGISVWYDEKETERIIHRLTAGVSLVNRATAVLIAEEMEEGKRIAKENIEHFVYAREQGPNTTYQRTFDLLNSVRSGTIERAGAVAAGQVYITRTMPNFKRAYYPVYVEHGFDAGAPYEGRGYWAATIAMLNARIPFKVEAMAKTVIREIK